MIRKHGKQFASSAELRRFENARPNGQRVADAVQQVAHLSEMVHEDCYVRHTSKDGATHVQHHRVWNRDRFAQALSRAAAQVGGKAKAELLTEGDYNRLRRAQELKGARADNPAKRRR